MSFDPVALVKANLVAFIVGVAVALLVGQIFKTVILSGWGGIPVVAGIIAFFVVRYFPNKRV